MCYACVARDGWWACDRHGGGGGGEGQAIYTKEEGKKFRTHVLLAAGRTHVLGWGGVVLEIWGAIQQRRASPHNYKLPILPFSLRSFPFLPLIPIPSSYQRARVPLRAYARAVGGCPVCVRVGRLCLGVYTYVLPVCALPMSACVSRGHVSPCVWGA